ncbi:MAG: hypothetical protein PHO37_02345 [Kiritimatiellae bacterium]|nr:hypothetical protein [Kiritimatiellia bacterium]
MKIRFIVFSLSLNICLIGHAAGVKMESKVFETTHNFREVAVPMKSLEQGGGEPDKPIGSPSDADHISFFTELGVTWPEGSHFKISETLGEIRITNTPANIQLFSDIMVLAHLTPALIEIQVDFVEYDLNDINQLASDDNISCESVQALWKKGRARLLSSSRALTRGGQEAFLSGATEYIYPTEFDVKLSKVLGKPDRNAQPATVEPCNFEMREVGNKLQVVPELDVCGNRIKIMIYPQHVSSPTWKNYSLPDGGNIKNAGQPAMQQPFFHICSISTQVTIANGATVLLGGGMNDEAGKKCVYAFLTAKLVDRHGNQIKVVNNPANIQRVTEVPFLEGATLPQIEARLDFVGYNKEDINQLLLDNNLSVTSLKKLWKQNNAQLISSSCVLTLSGQEAVTKGITEYIYPTEFDVKTTISTNSPDAMVMAPAVEPQNFEMREVGNIFQVVPEANIQAQNISVLLSPQQTSHHSWKNYGTTCRSKELPMEQPFFDVHSVATQATISNGATILLGGGTATPKGDNFVYAFLSTRLVDVHGEYIQFPDSDAKETNVAQPPDDDTKLIKRVYNVISACSDDGSSAITPEAIEQQSNEWKQFFSAQGVMWPEGSHVEYFSETGQLHVMNSYKNLKLFEGILNKLSVIPSMIRIQAEYIEYSVADINDLAKNGNISVVTLRKLWKAGKGRLLCSPCVLTRSGQEAIAKSVTEYIYPTEFKIESAKTPDGIIDIVEPQNFEMREVGSTLQVVPEGSAEGSYINLMLNPQLISSPAWKQYESGTNLSMPQPFFHTHSISTQVSVKSGETVLLGGGMNNKNGDKTVFVFLKAEIVDTKGEPITHQ